ncbi:MAG: radical SAM protein [Candidatus Thorarchaeota archaeon]
MIGSLQITVPAGCMNNCGFCIYRQHATTFKTYWKSDFQRWSSEVEMKLQYASSRVDTVMITSQGEPTLNMQYIEDVLNIVHRIAPNLAHIEIQTSGVGLTEEKLDFLYRSGVRVISLSVPALDPDKITEIMEIPTRFKHDPIELSRMIQSQGFILRLSIAMTKWFDNFSLTDIMYQLKENWKPDQVSFKKLYGADDSASENYGMFLTEFKANPDFSCLELLSHGVWKYDVGGFAVVWNDDCMITKEQETPRYLILQPDAKLYTRWDTKASVIF